VADGGQTSVPWQLSRSVIDSVGLAGAEFAPAESDRVASRLISWGGWGRIHQFCASEALSRGVIAQPSDQPP